MSRDDSPTRTDREASLSRRAVLGVASSAAAALAGCFGGGGSTPTETQGFDPVVTPEETATATRTETTPTTPATPDRVVELTDDRSFDPQAVVIDPGDTIEWVNGEEASLTHSVTAYESSLPEGAAYFASGGFDSESAARTDWNDGAQAGAIAPGESYQHTFERRGFYRYFCIPHENSGMAGFVEVGNPTPASTTTPSSGN